MEAKNIQSVEGSNTLILLQLDKREAKLEIYFEKYKIGENEYIQINSCSQNDYLNKARKTPSQLPTSEITLLIGPYRVAMGIIPTNEYITQKIKGVGFDMAKIKCFCNSEHVPFQFLVLDLHNHTEHLSIDFFSNLAI